MRSRTVTLSTCVENTAFPYFSFTAPKDHLHIRGEYPCFSAFIASSIGSPPHTWRILKLLNQVKSKPNRITSTYVENTFLHKSQNMFLEDHLHIRGEYQMDSKVQKLRIGSPPHTWRILNYYYSVELQIRITSTYVENTSSL